MRVNFSLPIRIMVTCAAVSATLTACGPEITGKTETESDVLTIESDVSGTAVIWSRAGDLYNVFDEVVDQFEKENPKIKIDHRAIDIDAKLQNTLITNTDVPDGVFLDDAKIGTFREYLWDVSEVLEQYKPYILAQKLSVNAIDGKIYGIPFDSNPGLLFYNEKALEKADINAADIETYDDLIAAAERYKAKFPESRPIHLEKSPFLAQLQLDMFASQLGTSIGGEDGQVQIDSPEFRRIFDFLNKVNSRGLGNRAEYLSPSDVEPLDRAIEVFYPWAIWFDFAPQQQLIETKGHWRAMPLPAWEVGGPRSGAMGGSSFVLPKNGANSAAAFKFYEYLMYREAGYRTVWGPNSVYPGGLNTSIPAYELALDADNPLFQSFPEMGNQDLWKVATTAAKEIPAGAPIPDWWVGAVDYLGNNLQKMYDGAMTPDEVIDTSTEQIQIHLINRK